MNDNLYKEYSNIPPKYSSWKENFYWAYANLQMLRATISSKQSSFGKLSYMVRTKAYKAYMEEKWAIRDMYELNKEKFKKNDVGIVKSSQISILNFS